MVESVDGGLKTHYQVVALGYPEEAYAVSINDLLRLLNQVGYTEVTFVDGCCGGVRASQTPSLALPTNSTPLALRSSPAVEEDATHTGKFETTLESPEATSDNASKHKSIARSQPAMKAFKEAVGRFTLTNYLKQEFVLVDQLDQWMQGKTSDRSRANIKWLFVLLVDSYESHRGIANHPVLTAIMDDSSGRDCNVILRRKHWSRSAKPSMSEWRSGWGNGNSMRCVDDRSEYVRK